MIGRRVFGRDIRTQMNGSETVGRFLTLFITVCLVIMASPGTVGAQSSLLDQGQKLLEGVAGDKTGSALSTDEIASGLREALRVGSDRVVEQVGRSDGYNGSEDIHIPLPENLQKVQSALEMVGLSQMADDLELRLNRGAERAAPEAKEVFFESISEMTMDDVERIYNGRDDEATRYLREKMTPDLTERFTPIVNDSLSDVGAIKSYDTMMASYKDLPLVPDVKSDITAYTVEKALDGMFFYLAKEEAKIRNNPAARTTELLQEVFGGN